MRILITNLFKSVLFRNFPANKVIILKKCELKIKKIKIKGDLKFKNFPMLKLLIAWYKALFFCRKEYRI